MSYWDWLPLEMQVYVLSLRDGQALIDRRESPASRALCYAIRQYGLLRERWQIGFIQVKPKLRFKKACLKNEHGLKQVKYGSIFLYGHYRDRRGVKRRAFLDFNYHKALAHCDWTRSMCTY